MTLICSGEVTKNMDKYCIDYYGIPEIVLMENAGRVAFERITKIEKDKDFSIENILIVCGTGNNAGDGFVMARYFANQRKDVDIFVYGDVDKMSQSTKNNYYTLSKMGVNIHNFNENDVFEINNSIFEICSNKDLIIDCLFGVGLNRSIDGYLRTVVSSINEVKEYKKSSLKVVSIDSPSGFNSTSGEVMGISVIADYTITFEYFKKGFLKYGSEEITGEVFVEKIGVPIDANFEKGEYAEFIDMEYVLDKLVDFPEFAHKGDKGKICIFAGNRGYTGAAFISTRACSRTGSGLTTVITDTSVQDILSSKLTEEMTCSIDDNERIKDLLDKSDAIAFGPGIGDSDQMQNMLDYLIDKYDKPKVIDADGLKMIEYNWLYKGNNCILTPHIGEFSSMTNKSIEEIERDRIAVAVEFAKKYDVVLVLKGKNTIVTDGEKTMVNTTGNQGMANGGMGDALTGIITSLCGQGYDNFTASCLGVYIHGLCGDEVYKINNTVSATELTKTIPYSLKLLYNSKKGN